MRDVQRNGKHYRVLKPRVQRPRFEIYREHGNQHDIMPPGWRWRLVGANGRILADSGESYTRKADVKRAVNLVVAVVLHARLIEV